MTRLHQQDCNADILKVSSKIISVNRCATSFPQFPNIVTTSGKIINMATIAVLDILNRHSDMSA